MQTDKFGISFVTGRHQLNLKITWHFTHVFQQMKQLGELNNFLEYDLEHLHQIPKAINNHTSCIKH
jgi:hypothetical protein